jgi:hypothetical protein
LVPRSTVANFKADNVNAKDFAKDTNSIVAEQAVDSRLSVGIKI